MAKGQGRDHGILQANIRGGVEASPHIAASTCFGPTIAYDVPHELVELKLHDAFKLIQSIRK
jgi:hypothetical protein